MCPLASSILSIRPYSRAFSASSQMSRSIRADISSLDFTLPEYAAMIADFTLSSSSAVCRITPASPEEYVVGLCTHTRETLSAVISSQAIIATVAEDAARERM